MSIEESYMAYVGGRVYGALFRLRAAKIAEHASRPDNGSQSERSEDEVSEEIVVFGDSSDPGGGGVDVITLDPWMFEAHIITLPPIIDLRPPPPHGGGDPPHADPCADLASAIHQFESSLAADNTALKGLDELIASAHSKEQKKVLRADKRKLENSIKGTKDAIEKSKAEMARLGCN